MGPTQCKTANVLDWKFIEQFLQDGKSGVDVGPRDSNRDLITMIREIPVAIVNFLNRAKRSPSNRQQLTR